jgi:hypothetical protein
VIGFVDKGESKSAVALLHERLPSAKAGDAAKRYWRTRLAALKTLLEE